MYKYLESVEHGEVYFDKEDDKGAINLIIKEEDNSLEALKQISNIEVRYIPFKMKSAEILVLMYRFNNSDDLIYVQYFDYSNNWCRKRIERFAIAENIIITILNNNNEVYHKTQIKNDARFIVRDFCNYSKKNGYLNNQHFKTVKRRMNIGYSKRIKLFNIDKIEYHNLFLGFIELLGLVIKLEDNKIIITLEGLAKGDFANEVISDALKGSECSELCEKLYKDIMDILELDRNLKVYDDLFSLLNNNKNKIKIATLLYLDREDEEDYDKKYELVIDEGIKELDKYNKNIYLLNYFSENMKEITEIGSFVTKAILEYLSNLNSSSESNENNNI